MNKIPMQGSKADKVVKAFKALRAISNLAPLGGMQGGLFTAWLLVECEYIAAYNACQWSEVEANRFCSQIVDE